MSTMFRENHAVVGEGNLEHSFMESAYFTSTAGERALGRQPAFKQYSFPQSENMDGFKGRFIPAFYIQHSSMDHSFPYSFTLPHLWVIIHYFYHHLLRKEVEL